tara:strand:+ start:217 stop:831 length:615 start_codon:yes stop_codon:yes gene_type:complete
MYNNLLSFGDVIELRLQCNVSKLLDTIKTYDWKQYNPRKEINRYGLSVTSLDGSMNGIDLDSLAEYNKENNTRYDESSFTTFTEVYHKCQETQKLIEPFKPWLWRTHFLNFRRGGYFPPHRDMRRVDEQESFRVLVPLRCCNPPGLYFMYENKPLYFNMGSAYFVNTNKMHTIFSFEDVAYMLVMNIQCTDESLKKVGELIRWK